MSGKYICRASNTAGSDSCSINLEVITCTCTVKTLFLLRHTSEYSRVFFKLHCCDSHYVWIQCVLLFSSFQCRHDCSSYSRVNSGTGGHGALPHIRTEKEARHRGRDSQWDQVRVSLYNMWWKFKKSFTRPSKGLMYKCLKLFICNTYKKGRVT